MNKNVCRDNAIRELLKEVFKEAEQGKRTFEFAHKCLKLCIYYESTLDKFGKNKIFNNRALRNTASLFCETREGREVTVWLCNNGFFEDIKDSKGKIHDFTDLILTIAVTEALIGV